MNFMKIDLTAFGMFTILLALCYKKEFTFVIALSAKLMEITESNTSFVY